MKFISKANIQHIIILILLLLLCLGLAISSIKLKENARTRPPKPTKAANAAVNTGAMFTKTLNPPDAKNKKQPFQNIQEGVENYDKSPQDYTGDVNRYRTDNLDVVYHDTPQDIIAQEGINTSGVAYVKDKDGNIVELPAASVGNVMPTYYQPGSSLYSSANFIPNYENSVYLSRTTGQPTYSTAVPDKQKLGGFCNQVGGSMYDIEQKCNALSSESCASTTCCVLLGGKKCVLGNKMGPTLKANYSDITIDNKEYYHYQGSCYGNCQ